MPCLRIVLVSRPTYIAGKSEADMLNGKQQLDGSIGLIFWRNCRSFLSIQDCTDQSSAPEVMDSVYFVANV